MGSIFKRKAFKNRKDKPWMIAYTDENGIRKIMTGSPDKTVSKEILRAREAEVLRRKNGISSAADERFQHHANRSIEEHFQEYIKHCHHVGMSNGTIAMKEIHLKRMTKDADVQRLKDLEPNCVESFLQKLKNEGRSARTVNHHRSDILAFMNWCKKTGRVRQNPLSMVPRLNEQEDRRRIRRPLTDIELARLLEVAAEQDRKNNGRYTPRHVVYLTAAMTGLRRNELRQLTWADVDLNTQTLNVRLTVGKAKRDDIIPLHNQLVEILLKMKSEKVEPSSRIFRTMPTIISFYKDLARARSKWINEAESGIERMRRKQADFLRKIDSLGRVVDLHAMRTTLGTNLALNGVAPQLAQQIMRHKDYRTTLSHYTVLGIEQTAKAINSLPSIKPQTAPHRAAPGTARTLQNQVLRCADMQSSSVAKKSQTEEGGVSEVVANTTVNTNSHHHAPIGTEKRASGFEPPTSSLGS